jgi:late competence protein required for DNA uptake (superfamily II DNA/RNA helicase)
MKCDRCRKWHQRTVVFDNDSDNQPYQERLCLTCLANLMLGRVSLEDEKNRVKQALKSILEDSPVSK